MVYAIEGQIRGTSAVHCLDVRQTRTASLMVDLKVWLENALSQISAESTLAQAIRYSLSRWAGLKLFLGNG